MELIPARTNPQHHRRPQTSRQNETSACTSVRSHHFFPVTQVISFRAARMDSRRSAETVLEAAVADDPSDSEVLPSKKSGGGLPTNWPSRVTLGLSVLLLVGLVAVAIWMRSSSVSPRVIEVRQLTNDGQTKFTPLFTDGPRLYFRESLPGIFVLYQVSSAGGDTVQVPSPVTVMLI
jgi:hypothetical protein